MAIYKEDIVTINLEAGSIFRSFKKHTIGTADSAADRFGIRVKRGDDDVDLTGCSCYGYFRDPQGNNIALTSNGTIDGNVAYVTLPQACYNYEGQFTLAIKLIGSGVTGTMRIVDGVIDNTNTGSAAAPTGTVPTYSEILSQYDAMVAATAAANGCTAETFDATKAYSAGKYVINSGALYKLTADHAANTTWANTSKVEVKFGNELSDVKSAFINSIDKAIRVSYQPTFSVIDGGVRISDGNNNTYSTRCRTQFVPVTPGNTYLIYLNNPNYKIITAWLYTSNSPTTGTRCIFCDNPFMVSFIAASSEVYMRIAFSKADDTQNITSDDKTAISSAIKIYTLTDELLKNTGVPADSKAVGDMLSNIIDTISNYVFDWSNFASSTYTTGWRAGYYKTSDGSAVSDDETAIRTRAKFDTRYYTDSDAFAIVTPPSGYYVYVSVFDASDNYIETLNKNAHINESVVFKIIQGRKYAFTVGAFSNDASDHLTDEFVDTCVLNVLYATKDRHFNNKTSDSYIWNDSLKYALKLPSSYSTKGDAVPLLILCHGLSQDVSASSWSRESLASDFADAGYAVLDVSKVTTQDWCNPTLIKRYKTAVDDAVKKYNIIPKVVYGESMGSLIASCVQSFFEIKAMAIGGIRMDFEARYAECTAEQKAIIDANLGFTDGYDAEKAAGWDKTAYSCVNANGITINQCKIPPTLFVVGDSDDLTKTESLARIAELHRGGNIVQVNEYTGNHSSVCTLSAGTSKADVLAWFELYR